MPFIAFKGKKERRYRWLFMLPVNPIDIKISSKLVWIPLFQFVEDYEK